MLRTRPQEHDGGHAAVPPLHGGTRSTWKGGGDYGRAGGYAVLSSDPAGTLSARQKGKARQPRSRNNQAALKAGDGREPGVPGGCGAMCCVLVCTRSLHTPASDRCVSCEQSCTPTPSLALCSFVALFLDQRGRWSCLRTPSMHVAQLCTYKARCTRGCVPVDPHARWRVVACMHAASAPAMQCVRKANTSTTVMTRWSVAATDRCRTHVTARHCQPAHDHARLGPSQ